MVREDTNHSPFSILVRVTRINIITINIYLNVTSLNKIET